MKKMMIILGFLLVGLTFQGQATFKERIEALNNEKGQLEAQFSQEDLVDLTEAFKKLSAEKEAINLGLNILSGKNQEYNAYFALDKNPRKKHSRRKEFAQYNDLMGAKNPKQIADKCKELNAQLAQINQKIQNLLKLRKIAEDVQKVYAEQQASIAEALKIVEQKEEVEKKRLEEERLKREEVAQAQAQAQRRLTEKKEAARIEIERREKKKKEENARMEKEESERRAIKSEERKKARLARQKEKDDAEKSKRKQEQKNDVGLFDSMINYTKEHPILVGSATASVVLPTSVFGYFVVKKHSKLLKKQEKAIKEKETFKYEGRNLWLVASKKVLGNMSEAVKRQGRKIRSLVKSNDKKVKTSEVA